MQEGYSDLRVIVTGGASGLGLSIATRLLEGGAKVHVCDIAEAGLLRLNEQHAQVSTSIADVSKAEDVARLFEEAAASFGDLTGLVNNVGIAGPIGPIETLPLDAWTAAMATNLTSAMLCMQKAVPILRRNGGGAIVNMSSVAGRAAFPLRASYCSTRCLVPAFDGALSMQRWKDALWDRFYTGAPARQRQSVERYNIVKRA